MNIFTETRTNTIKSKRDHMDKKSKVFFIEKDKKKQVLSARALGKLLFLISGRQETSWKITNSEIS